MLKGIRHTGIVVEDLAASLYFYRDLLGFQIDKYSEESGAYIEAMLALPEVAVTTVKMSAPDGQMIELLDFHSRRHEKKPHEINEPGITHIAFEVDNLDRVYDQLKAADVQFNSNPQRSPDGYAKIAFCRAPEGTYIELVEVL